jgi:uncharacterized RDD family membrane protein YckC
MSSAAMESSDESTVSGAGPVRRLMALMYDGFLLLGVLFLATLIPAIITHQLKPMTGDKVYDLPPLFQGAGFSIYLVVITLLFFSYFWRKNGQTLGMQAWRLKLVNLDGKQPSWVQCFLRGAVAIVSVLAAGAGYFWILIDKENLSWQDRASNTRVLLLPKKK